MERSVYRKLNAGNQASAKYDGWRRLLNWIMTGGSYMDSYLNTRVSVNK